jgi:geranyl-CoA carboxylase alpha subunit
MTFSKLLIANRGEIACRVIRTARSMGYQTVAVYSDADRNAPHVRLSDEAVHIGGSAATDSYLRVDALLQAARKTGADAVHPGYGFLSESASFAQACLDAGLVLIGPPPSAMQAMGNKAMAKRRMIAAGVPCAPGYLGEDQDDARLTEEALKLGFPLLVKAIAGGGGRGMRRVDAARELPQALESARREAQNAFGDGTLMLERQIENARHIEIQVFADAHGNAVYLGERDCTAQRRRQKVIEEAPSPAVNEALRQAMGRDAVAAALAVGYRGAGTVEFVVDAGLKHYFLEMNTRLQVEHTVTEMVTGFDLVEWQLRVAAGEPLPVRQADIKLSGHAIEARLYMEDPYADFAPQTGTVRWWHPELARVDGVRIDDGIEVGSEISPFYDAMVAKLIVHGRDRNEAIRRLRAALQNTPLLGVRNNGRFLMDLLNHGAFRAGAMTTDSIDQWQKDDEALLQRPTPGDDLWCLAAAALALQNGAHWRSDSVAAFDLLLQCDERTRTLRVRPGRSGQVQVSWADQEQQVQIRQFDPGQLCFEINGVTRRAVAILHQRELHLALDGAVFVFVEPSPFPEKNTTLDATQARSPVAGKVTQIQVAPGHTVAEGQALLCVEAMKMEMWLTAKAAGRVLALHAQVGEQVESGALLVEIELDDKREP